MVTGWNSQHLFIVVPEHDSTYLVRVGTTPRQSHRLPRLDLVGPAGEGQTIGRKPQGKEGSRHGNNALGEVHLDLKRQRSGEM